MPDDSRRLTLVTGGAGFIGSHLIRKLLAKDPGRRIVSVDNYFTGSHDNHVQDDRVRYLEGDTADVAALWAEHGLDRIDTVYHLGEYSRIAQAFDDPDRVWEFSLLGTREVLRLCLEHEARLVYAASSSVLGNGGGDERLSPYAWTKAKNVEYIRNNGDWFGLDHVITYFYNVYGPGQISTGSYATVIGVFEEQLRAGQPFTVVEPGTQSRDFTHVDDIVDGVIRCAEKGFGDGYLLGRGEEHRVIDVARMFGGPIEMVPARRGERFRSRADNSKARALGWTPWIDLAEYVAELRASTGAGTEAAAAPPSRCAASRTKRTLDITLSAALLIVLFPLMVLVGLAVATSSAGPVIYRQARDGFGGRSFTMLKFRTMYDNSSVDLTELLKAEGCEMSISAKPRHDPRITAVGRVLRVTSLDELPQLVNVLRGDMSLVGPRPSARAANATLRPEDRVRRLSVKPGVTGLWQVSGRSLLTAEEMIGLDLRYIDRWCPKLDLLILLRTLPTVLRTHGAR